MYKTERNEVNLMYIKPVFLFFHEKTLRLREAFFQLVYRDFIVFVFFLSEADSSKNTTTEFSLVR